MTTNILNYEAAAVRAAHRSGCFDAIRNAGLEPMDPPNVGRVLDWIDAHMDGRTTAEVVKLYAAEGWADVHAVYLVGTTVRVATGTFHVADGATGVVVRVMFDHTHPGGHTPDCFRPQRVWYAVRINGNTPLRFNFHQDELRWVRGPE